MSRNMKNDAGSQGIRAPANKKKAGGPSGYWHNRRYGSVSLRRKSKLRRSASVTDKSVWSISMEEANRHPYVKNSEVWSIRSQFLRRSSLFVIVERDVFLDLLSKVQDNRYENQRYVLRPGTRGSDVTDQGPVNGVIPNGDTCSDTSTPDIPTIEVSPSGTPPASLHEEDSGTPRDSSLTPPALRARSAVTPGRRAMEALNKMIAEAGPYPMIIEPPDKGWVVHVDEDIDSACSEDGTWRAPEISTEHFVLDSDTAAFAYGKHFMGRPHKNYMGRDPKVGPVLFSIVKDEDYRGTNMRLILRTQNETVYRVVPESQLYHMKEIEDIIRFTSKLGGIEEIKVERAIRILYPKVREMTRRFDEHKVAHTHKFGVVYQKQNQTSEEELFRNRHSSPAFDEFLEILGDKIQLKGFNGYRGGLDVAGDQTGEHSVYTQYKGREVMFHVSTLLPFDEQDPQQVQRKRHIGNDIVVVIFQEENTPFCPNMVRSHFVHCYIVVQVEHPNTDHTVYKVSMACKDHVPEFGPPLCTPSIFRNGPELRDWLLSKLLNAEFNCHKAPDFLKLAMRTHAQLFRHLVDDIANTMDDVDHPTLGKGGFAQAFEPTKSPRRQRRKTFSSIFNRKDTFAVSQPKKKMSETIATGRKSSSYQKLRMRSSNSTSRMNLPPMMVGSTPDLSIIAEQSSRSFTDSPDEAKSAENTLTKSHKLKRRFTFTRSKSPSKSGTRRSSEAAPPSADFSSNLFRRRKASTPTSKGVTLLSKRDSSDDSSINWSIPSDLPGIVEGRGERGSMENMFGDADDIRARCRSTPTIAERRESESSVETAEMRISHNGPVMVDVGVQVNGDGHVFQFPDVFPSPFDYHHPHNIANRSPQETRSVPQSPYCQSRRTGTLMKVIPLGKSPTGNGEVMRSFEWKLNNGSGRRRTAHVGSSPQLNVNRTNGHVTETQKRENERGIMKASSLDSVSTDLDDACDSLVCSLQSLTVESNKLHEENVTLHQENMRLATQNQRLLSLYKSMKQELAAAQKEVKNLQSQLEHYPTEND